MAEKYLLHRCGPSDWKLAWGLTRNGRGPCQARPSNANGEMAKLHDIEDEYRSVIAKFGKEFVEDYGWAASAVRYQALLFSCC